MMKKRTNLRTALLINLQKKDLLVSRCDIKNDLRHLRTELPSQRDRPGTSGCASRAELSHEVLIAHTVAATRDGGELRVGEFQLGRSLEQRCVGTENEAAVRALSLIHI